MMINKGRIEEIGAAEEIYNYPQKDYTRQLITAIPDAKLEDIQNREAGRTATLA